MLIIATTTNNKRSWLVCITPEEKGRLLNGEVYHAPLDSFGLEGRVLAVVVSQCAVNAAVATTELQASLDPQRTEELVIVSFDPSIVAAMTMLGVGGQLSRSSCPTSLGEVRLALIADQPLLERRLLEMEPIT